MSESLDLPFIWPFGINEFAYESAPPWKSLIEPKGNNSVTGVIWGHDQQGML